MEESGEHIVAGARDFILKFVLRIFRMISWVVLRLSSQTRLSHFVRLFWSDLSVR
ncbi:BnaCnng26580D [Brassica napus]|uniref:BnaCnng26580D protein n=1 Tax=Brassica napus TaxID=3708 RepID=A0A078ISY9_BRANA|nr:BnaCnng26580D [Brassica napus]